MTDSNLEDRLAALEPVSDDELAGRILHAIETRHCPVALPTQFFAQVAQPAQHSSCFAFSLPLLTGIAGGLIGAAVMFLAVTFFVPPRVEIREVVRYVPTEVSVDVPVERQPEIKPAEPEPKVQPDEPSPKSNPQEIRKLPWVLAWLYPVVTNQTLAYNAPADLDAMLEQRARLARNSANREPRPQLVRFERDNSPPSEFSPVMYKDMIEKENRPERTKFL